MKTLTDKQIDSLFNSDKVCEVLSDSHVREAKNFVERLRHIESKLKEYEQEFAMFLLDREITIEEALSTNGSEYNSYQVGNSAFIFHSHIDTTIAHKFLTDPTYFRAIYKVMEYFRLHYKEDPQIRQAFITAFEDEIEDIAEELMTTGDIDYSPISIMEMVKNEWISDTDVSDFLSEKESEAFYEVSELDFVDNIEKRYLVTHKNQILGTKDFLKELLQKIFMVPSRKTN